MRTKKSIIYKIIESWANSKGNVNTTNELIEWVAELNKSTIVHVSETRINSNTYWFYDRNSGIVTNKSGRFFNILGANRIKGADKIFEQPIIEQSEIGYLGIICKEIDGVLNFLMQAKIEPGNVNCVQISPTIQATKSNFTRAHGGKSPAYLSYFENLNSCKIIYDQIQSEQASRFYKKRNRNIIILIEDEIETLSNFRWMTLGQIKCLMQIDNLVNMDTRTVLSGLPLFFNCIDDVELENISSFFNDKALFKSIFKTNPSKYLCSINRILNDYKMFSDEHTVLIPLSQLNHWSFSDDGIGCQERSDFDVRFYDIEIEGREVRHWTQPLFRAIGSATFGLFTRVIDGVREFLIKAMPEIGSFDLVEMGPTIQWESSHEQLNDNSIDFLFRKKYEDKQGIIIDVVLSEEGGRFYHEQNNNVIIEINEDEIINLPKDYVWASYSALSHLIQTNNCLNIQLRNLLSLINI